MKKLMLFAMWLAASAAAVGVAWAGVSVVDHQVVDPPSASTIASPTPLPAANQEDPTTADTTPPAVEIDRPSSDRGGEPTTAAVSDKPPTTQPTPAGTTAAMPTPEPTAPSTTQPATTPAPATSTAPIPTPEPAPTASFAPAATTQTFTLVGGTAAISFSSVGVEVLWATPNAGFDVRIEPESPGIKVEFRADNHRSRVDAWWSGGPQSSIREEPRD